MSGTGDTGGIYRRYASVRTVPNTPLKNCKTIWGIPSDLLVSGRRNAIPRQIEPAQRHLMRRALLSRCWAETQTYFIMYPWQPSLPRSRKCEKKPSAAGEQRAKNKTKIIFYIYMCCCSAGRMVRSTRSLGVLHYTGSVCHYGWN